MFAPSLSPLLFIFSYRRLIAVVVFCIGVVVQTAAFNPDPIFAGASMSLVGCVHGLSDRHAWEREMKNVIDMYAPYPFQVVSLLVWASVP